MKTYTNVIRSGLLALLFVTASGVRADAQSSKNPGNQGGSSSGGSQSGSNSGRRIGLPAQSGLVAQVNGVALTMNDVLPPTVGPDATDQTIDLATLQAMRQRAIDRQLILQTAPKQGISLSAARQAALTNLKSALSASTPYAGQSSAGAQATLVLQLKFQMEDATAQYLLMSLVPVQIPAPGTAPVDRAAQVQQYLQQLRAGAKIVLYQF